METYFEVITPLGVKIRTTEFYWNRIILLKHPLLRNYEKEIKRVLHNPEQIRLSQKDNTVYLYYGEGERHFLCVVARHLNSEGYIITAYLTDNIKIGRLVWRKQGA